MDKTYLIDYCIINKSDQRLKSKKPARIRNSMSELHAQVKLEEYLKQKYPWFKKLVVDSCREDYNGENFFDYFNDIVNRNPFR